MFVHKFHPKNDIVPIHAQHEKSRILLIFTVVLKISPSANKCQESSLKPLDPYSFSSHKRFENLPKSNTESKSIAVCQLTHFLSRFSSPKRLPNHSKSAAKADKNAYQNEAQKKHLFLRCQLWRRCQFSAPGPGFREFRLYIDVFFFF